MTFMELQKIIPKNCMKPFKTQKPGQIFRDIQDSRVRTKDSVCLET